MMLVMSQLTRTEATHLSRVGRLALRSIFHYRVPCKSYVLLTLACIKLVHLSVAVSPPPDGFGTSTVARSAAAGSEDSPSKVYGGSSTRARLVTNRMLGTVESFSSSRGRNPPASTQMRNTQIPDLDAHRGVLLTFDSRPHDVGEVAGGVRSREGLWKSEECTPWLGLPHTSRGYGILGGVISSGRTIPSVVIDIAPPSPRRSLLNSCDHFHDVLSGLTPTARGFDDRNAVDGIPVSNTYPIDQNPSSHPDRTVAQ